VAGTVSMAGVGAASAATLTATNTAPAPTAVTASPALQSSLQIIVWHPPYGCIVCGLGGFDPILGESVLPATAGPVGV